MFLFYRPVRSFVCQWFVALVTNLVPNATKTALEIFPANGGLVSVNGHSQV